MAQMGRPRQVTDQQLLEAMPGSAKQIAARVGMKTSGVWGRLRNLEAGGESVRDAERVPHIWHKPTYKIFQLYNQEDNPLIVPGTPDD